MTEHLQKGVLSQFVYLLKLLTTFAIKKLNLQHVLYFLAFLTFGLGDGITAAFMMNRLGSGVESNPLIGHLYQTQGFEGVVIGKIWLTVLLLLGTHIVQSEYTGNMYWTVNGFLVSLTAFGLMAVNANLSVISGEIPSSRGEIIFIYLSLMLALISAGSFVDEHKDAFN